MCQKVSDSYHEEKLSDDMKVQVDAHLETCKDCREQYNVESLAYRIIDEEKEAEFNPFLATRIMSQIENLETERKQTIPIYEKLLRPALITGLLCIALISGVTIGNLTNPEGYKESIPEELALIDDSSIESVDLLLNE
jgi:predicted anti-sigma-YlaC factor YlaD